MQKGQTSAFNALVWPYLLCKFHNKNLVCIVVKQYIRCKNQKGNKNPLVLKLRLYCGIKSTNQITLEAGV